VNQRFAAALLDGATKGDVIDYSASLVSTNLGNDFSVITWTGNTSPIVVEIQYMKADGTPEATVYPTTIDKPAYF